MKIKNLKAVILLFALLAVLTILGCKRDNLVTPDPPPHFSISGAYILSEGAFSPGTAKLSFYDIQNDVFTDNIFNPGQLGLFPDGMVYEGGFIYLTEQGNFGSEGKIYKLDSNGTVLMSAPAGINPYSLTISNNKIYVTNGPSSRVTVFNKSDLSFVKSIPVGVFPQEITSLGFRVFVCNTSLFGGPEDSTVSMINSQIDEVVSVINLRKDPTSIVVNNDFNIVVGCGGGSNMIFTIDRDTLGVIDSVFVPDGFGKDIAVDKETSNIYFISSNGNIVRLNQQLNIFEIVIQAASGANFYGYNFDSKNRKHYVLSAGNFSKEGQLSLFQIGGTFEKSFTTGIAPRRVVFK